MITASEAARIKKLKADTLKFGINGVSDADKQWALDLVKREAISVRRDVIQRAKNSGFNVDGMTAI